MAVAVLVTLALNYLLMAQLSLCLVDMPWRTYAGAHFPGVASAALVGVSVFASTELLRSWSLAPAAILLVCPALPLPRVVFLPVPLSCRRLPDGRTRLTLVRRTQRARPDDENYASTCSQTTGSLERHVLAQLTSGLAAARVRYCRWKSHVDWARLLTGAGDLDLLVDRSHAARFLRVAQELGFTRVVGCFAPSSAEEVHLYGLDPDTGALLHLHLNFSLGDRCLDELVLGNCLPAESSGLLAGMPVVQPQAELIAFVIRTMAQYGSLRALPRMLGKSGILHAKLQGILAAPTAASWQESLQAWLPDLPPSLFTEFLEALHQPTPWVRRFRLLDGCRASTTCNNNRG